MGLLCAAISIFYVLLHGIYAILIVLGATQLRRYRLGVKFDEFQRIADSPLTLPFTVVVPAFNEELVIINTVLGALNLRYPQHEVIVVNDGSSDRTLSKLIERFGLRRVQKVGQMRLPTEPVAGVYESLEYPNLIVVDKANGKRADAINAAVNLARYPLLCIIDADSILEPDALLHIVRPFLRNSSMIAAGGIVRPANGLGVEDRRIVSCGVPLGTRALIQALHDLPRLHCAPPRPSPPRPPPR